MGVYVLRLSIRQPEVFFAGWGAPMGPVLLVMCGTAAVVLIVMLGFLRGTTIRKAFHAK